MDNTRIQRKYETEFLMGQDLWKVTGEIGRHQQEGLHVVGAYNKMVEMSGGKDILRRTIEEAVPPLKKQKKICQYRHTTVTAAHRWALRKGLWFCRQDFL